MDNTSLFGDTFSSLDDEQIFNIKRPSLISVSSDECNFSNRSTCNNSDESVTEIDEQIPFGDKNLQCSTPYHKHVNNEEIQPKKSYNCLYDVDDNRLTKSIKRLSLSVFDDSVTNNFIMNKSVSLHDISTIPNIPSLHRDLITYSTETLQSNSGFTVKSKDSGFQRSTSCTSITTTNGSKKYDHIPSKVKQYIQNIKQMEALNKMKKQLLHTSYPEETIDSSPSSDSVPISKKDLLNKVKELEDELKEKDDMIDQLAKNHNKLQLKYADAENRIDDLRIKMSCINKQPVIVSEEKLIEMFETRRSFNDSYLKDNSAKHISDTGHEYISSSSLPNSLLKQAENASDKCKVNISPQNSLPSNILKSSSCKQINVNKPTIQKSVSHVDNVIRIAKSNKCNLNAPYEENCFDKSWEKSGYSSISAYHINIHPKVSYNKAQLRST